MPHVPASASTFVAAQPPRLLVVDRPVAELRPDPRNPRQHTTREVRQIARSITAFGFNVPVLIGGSDKVVAGHGRLLACRDLGWTEVPTICLDHLSEPQARAFMLADNRLTEASTWDDKLLAETLHDLSLQELDFELDVTGFATAEIDLRIASLDIGVDADADPP